MRIRAWNSQTKQMFSPEEMARDQMTLLPTGQFINVDSVSTRLSVIYSLSVMVPMLSSGYTDAGGVEMYEGDIIEYEGEIIKGKGFRAPIIFSDGMMGVAMHPDPGEEIIIPVSSLMAQGICKVIGNIYENPEEISS